MDILENELPRLLWQCRRGMLELDLILNAFVKNVYISLNEQEKTAFQCLLKCSDPEIYTWIMGHDQPENEELLQIVRIIQHHHAAPSI